MNRAVAALRTLLLLLICLAPTAARGDGFIIIYPPEPERRVVPPRGHFVFAPLEVTYHRVSVTINDQVATTTVDQEFYNPNPQRLEGTYMFPLPEGAHIDKFSMDVNGKMMDAELLDAGKARTIYEDIVRRSRDPALLEYVGRDAFKARIFPIEPHSRKPIKITYTQLLKSDTGLVEYTYPLNTEKFSSRPLGDVSVKVSVECKDPIKALYSPSHTVEIKRDGDRRATVGWEQRNVRPDTDFKLILSRKQDPVGIDLLTYRKGSGDDGYFLLLASPGMQEARANQLQMRDVCFVLDTSGSMSENGGKKMEQAKKALSFCLQNLNEGDRFEIVRFSTEAEAFFGELKDASKENIAKAQEFVKTLKPIGGTAIEDALARAAKTFTDQGKTNPARPFVVIFLTDGQPTIGETNEDALLKKSSVLLGGNCRVFSFGIGNDVNTHLLDRIASETKSFSQYVGPEEDIEVKVSNFYTKIRQPVLANVNVEFTGGDVRTSQLYPGAMPDLFKGEMLVVFGRYSGKGPAAVKVTGTLNGEKQTFAQDVTFTDVDTKNPYIPQLWATRRVGWLLDQIRLNGEKQELRDEVVRLAREHGIVTPYTAYLIMEDEQRRNVPVAVRNLREFEQDGAAPLSRERYHSARSEAEDATRRAGAGAVANARDIDALKSSTNQEVARQQGQQLAKSGRGAGGYGGGEGASASGGVGQPYAGRPAAGQPAGDATAATTSPAEPSAEGYKVARDYGGQSRVVNGRAFFQNGRTWTDSTAQQNTNLKRQEVVFNSEAYFDLLRRFPEASQWLSLGEEVDVVLGDTLFVIR